MATQPVLKMTEQEYLDHERKADWPSEYLNGEMFAMAGPTSKHGEILMNIGIALAPDARKRGCRLFANGWLRIEASGLYTYPDLMIVCGQPEYFGPEAGEILTNPSIIFEVLSRTTQDYDLGAKFNLYRSIPSLREYVTVEQYAPRVQHRLRQSDNTWKFTFIEDLQATIATASLESEIPLSLIYENITFESVAAR